MKRFIHLSIFLFCALLMAQNENYNGISYQGVARDAEGGILSNQQISVIFRIVDNAQGEGQLYQETHTVTTDSYGLFNLSVGSGSQEQYSFGEIQWGSYDYCGLAVSIDFNNDGIYADMGVMKMEDVPTAKWAKKSEEANYANEANWATMAGEANNSDFANYAGFTDYADNAEYAEYAEYAGNAGLANNATYANNASGDLLDIITELQEQVAALQNNNANNDVASLMQTIETQSAQIAQLQNQVNDLYSALEWVMPQINGMTVDQVIDYSGGDINGFDLDNIIINGAD